MEIYCNYCTSFLLFYFSSLGHLFFFHSPNCQMLWGLWIPSNDGLVNWVHHKTPKCSSATLQSFVLSRLASLSAMLQLLQLHENWQIKGLWVVFASVWRLLQGRLFWISISTTAMSLAISCKFDQICVLCCPNSMRCLHIHIPETNPGSQRGQLRRRHALLVCTCKCNGWPVPKNMEVCSMSICKLEKASQNWCPFYTLNQAAKHPKLALCFTSVPFHENGNNRVSWI